MLSRDTGFDISINLHSCDLNRVIPYVFSAAGPNKLIILILSSLKLATNFLIGFLLIFFEEMQCTNVFYDLEYPP